MRTFTKALLISFVIIQVASLVFVLTNNNSMDNPERFGEAFGIVNFLGGVLVFFLGVLVAIPRERREVGKGMMAAGALMALLGTALCSQFLRL
jgi:hypothetical protein